MSRPNSANKSRLPPLDGSMLTAITRGSVVGKRARGGTLSACNSSLRFNGVRYVTRLRDNVTNDVSFHTSVDGKTWTEVTTLTPGGGTMTAFAPKITDPNKNIY
jgi:hypothetical protein